MKSLVASSATRVRRHTSSESQRRIDRRTERTVRTRAQGGSRSIERRLRELDREWDVERTIQANASSLALSGTLLGLFVHRGFFALPVAVCAFLLQHAIQGWCPPVPLLRRLGFRTSEEIARERYALKAVRGDFGARRSPDAALRAARA